MDFAFEPPAMIALESPANALAVGDVTGDFRDDIVVVTHGVNLGAATGAVLVFEQQADGTYGTPRRFPFPFLTHPVHDVELGDLNGDGTLDIAFGHSENLTVMMADGLSGFIHRTINNAHTACDDVAVAQLDTQDGVALGDVVCYASHDALRIHYDVADAARHTAVHVAPGPNRGDIKVDAHDVTGDGLPDLVGLVEANGSFWLRVNQGSRSFGSPLDYSLGSRFQGLAVGDINGDRRADVITTNGLVFKATGRAAEPLAPPESVVINFAKSLAIADLDRNGQADLLALYGTSAGSDGYLGRTMNSYHSGLLPEVRSPHPDAMGAEWNALDTGDLNGDGCTDAAAVIDRNLVLSYGIGCIRPAPISAVPRRVADLSGDGVADLMWQASNSLYPWIIKPDRIETGCCNWSAMGDIAALGDFDGDGVSDTLLTDGRTVRLYRTIFEGRAFTSDAVAVHPAGWKIFGAGDVNGDGTADIAWYRPATREIYFWLMRAHDVVGGRGGMVAPHGTPPVAVSDFNGDGRADILLGNGTELQTYLSTVFETYSAHTIGGVPYGWNLRSVGDIDGDRMADLLWHRPADGGLYAWRLSGSRVIQGRALPAAPPGAAPADIADFDGDRRPDILLHNGGDLWVYFQAANNGYVSRYLASYPVGWSLARPYGSPSQ